jgi:hypothetical protein
VRSKWLEWTPEAGSVGFEGFPSTTFSITRSSEGEKMPAPPESPDKIIERTPKGEPTKPTEPSSHCPDDGSPMRPSNFWWRQGDVYGWRVHSALDAICGIPGPEGLVVWLGEHSPPLHRKLTSDLPDEISRAWDARIPLEKFDALCFDLVDTYQHATELYHAVQRKA